MRKLFLVLAIIFTVLGVIFVFLPLGTIGLMPVGLALLFGFSAFKKSDENQKRIVKILLIFAGLSFVAIIGKELFIKDEVIQDVQFEKTKIESKKEDKKELEQLENDLN